MAGLTKTIVDAATYQGNGTSQFVVYDGDFGGNLPGFGLRVYPTGAKAFVLRYRNASGRIRLLTIGAYGVLTVAQARDEARRRLLEIQTGTDPLEVRQQKRHGEKFSDFASEYLSRYSQARKKTWREDERRLKTHILPAFGRRQLAEIKRADIADIHAKIGARTPYEANRVLALLSSIFSVAVEWGRLPEDSVNPATRVRKFNEVKRDRWVRESEMPALLGAIEAEDNVYIRAALVMYLLTGLRKSELLSIQWNAINFAEAELRLEQTKAGRSHVVPLSTSALELLRDIPRMAGNPYVFPGRKEGSHLVNISKAWDRIRAAADLQDVRLHDLRRTVGSWLAADGASLILIGKVLNHSNASTTQIYARLADTAARGALEAHGSRLLQVSADA